MPLIGVAANFLFRFFGLPSQHEPFSAHQTSFLLSFCPLLDCFSFFFFPFQSFFFLPLPTTTITITFLSIYPFPSLSLSNKFQMWFLHSSGRWREKEERGGEGRGWGGMRRAGGWGEGARGEAHELKQGAHDEEEEPMYCSRHTHTHTDMHWKTCRYTHTDTHEQREGVCMCLRACVSGNGGGGMSVL